MTSARTDDVHQPRFAYMLLTHKDPHHVEELATRILELSPFGHVIIHHDLASEPLLDLVTVWESVAAFARKVDSDERPQVLKALDDRVDRERGVGAPKSMEGPVA